LTPSVVGVFLCMGMAISPLGGMPKHRVRLSEPRTLHARLFLTSPL
jgi:hypothetical protein